MYSWFGNIFKELGKYELSYVYFKNAYEEYFSTFEEKPEPWLAVILEQLIDILLLLNNFQEAEKYALQLVELIGKYYDDELIKMSSYLYLLKVYLQANKMNEAEKTFLLCNNEKFDELGRANFAGRIELIYYDTFLIISERLLIQNNLTITEACIKDFCERLDTDFEDKSIHSLDYYLKIGNLFAKYGLNDKAKYYYSQCLDKAKDIFGTNHKRAREITKLIELL
ncbi:MAG: hypothetical protein V1720_09500, partial [bacterium]